MYDFSEDKYKVSVLDFLNKEIEEDDGNAFLYYKRAQFYSTVGKIDQAFSDLDKATQLDSTNAVYAYLLARMSFDQNHHEKSLKYALVAEQYGCKEVDLYVLLVYLFQEFDDNINADYYLKRLKYLDPSHKHTNYLVALNYLYASDTVDAILFFDKALEDMPEEENIYAHLSDIYLSQNEIPKAEFFLEKGLKVNKSSENLLIALAELKGKQGDKKEQYRLLIDLYTRDSLNYRVNMKLGQLYLADRKMDSTLYYLGHIKRFSASDFIKGNKMYGDVYYYKRSNDSALKYYDLCLGEDSLDPYFVKQKKIIGWRIRNKNKQRDSSQNINNFVLLPEKKEKKDTIESKEEVHKSLFDIW